jgi:hypothetical protein
VSPQWQYIAQAANCTVVQFVPAKNREEVAQILRALQNTELDVACSSQPVEISTEQVTWQHDAVHSGTRYRHLWEILPSMFRNKMEAEIPPKHQYTSGRVELHQTATCITTD